MPINKMRGLLAVAALVAIAATSATFGGRHAPSNNSVTVSPAPAPVQTPKTPNDLFRESRAAQARLDSGFYENGLCENYLRKNPPSGGLPYEGSEKTICIAQETMDRSSVGFYDKPKGGNFVAPPR
jgi:hypothetical protein